MQATQEQSLMSGLQKEFSNQKQMFKSNLSELQEKKNSINQELTQKIEKLNQVKKYNLYITYIHIYCILTHNMYIFSYL